jgi:hypothetical protein
MSMSFIGKYIDNIIKKDLWRYEYYNLDILSPLYDPSAKHLHVIHV